MRPVEPAKPMKQFITDRRLFYDIDRQLFLLFNFGQDSLTNMVFNNHPEALEFIIQFMDDRKSAGLDLKYNIDDFITETKIYHKDLTEYFCDRCRELTSLSCKQLELLNQTMKQDTSILNWSLHFCSDTYMFYVCVECEKPEEQYQKELDQYNQCFKQYEIDLKKWNAETINKLKKQKEEIQRQIKQIKSEQVFYS